MILSGDAILCQGYSKPGAGSDLASLRTRAVLDGDSLVLNSYKIWTTWDHHADWMFALVRTSDAGARQHGISFVLIDMKTPGITRRAITTIANGDEYCEVFFDNVRVPLEHLVGEIDKGWAVTTALLSEERLRIGSPALALKALARLSLQEAALHAERIARTRVEVDTLTASFLNVAEAEHDPSGGPAADSSYLKILATETVLTVLDAAQQIAGEEASLREEGGVLDYSEMFLQSRR
ncbi:MAG: acyl-CoA dehydrogenase family protein [Candidatus Protistobacter heckmanni]|nr:acyl-CoA dehydrogenase family protein [Candidatus Protistobacter heckmanni]